MTRKLVTLALLAALVCGPVAECFAQNGRSSSIRGAAAGGPLARWPD